MGFPITVSDMQINENVIISFDFGCYFFFQFSSKWKFEKSIQFIRYYEMILTSMSIIEVAFQNIIKSQQDENQSHMLYTVYLISKRKKNNQKIKFKYAFCSIPLFQ